MPCAGGAQTYFLKKGLVLAACFSWFATGLETCFIASVINFISGRVTMMTEQA